MGTAFDRQFCQTPLFFVDKEIIPELCVLNYRNAVIILSNIADCDTKKVQSWKSDFLLHFIFLFYEVISPTFYVSIKRLRGGKDITEGADF